MREARGKIRIDLIEEELTRLRRRVSELDARANQERREAESARARHNVLETRLRELRDTTDLIQSQYWLLQSILESMGDGVIVADENENILFSNSAVEHIFGIRPTSSSVDVYSEQYSTSAYLPDTVTPYPPNDLPVVRAIRGEEVYAEEVYVRRQQLPHSMWIVITAKPLKDAKEVLRGAIAVFSDISDRKRAEEVLARQAQELARSNAELEQFAYVASHDLQEPLRKIQAFGDRLVENTRNSLSERALDYLNRMQDAAGRMKVLINDLLTFSRVTSRGQPFVQVDLNKVVQEVLSDLEAWVDQNGARVEVSNLQLIDADPTQMRQLFQNLISNGIKFHRKDVYPMVKVDCKLLKSNELGANGMAQGGEFCRLTVEDNGIGFDEKYLDRIFTVFQRLHGRGEYGGTGIGLAICQKVVQRHGGSITATSTPGQGSTFVVTLPVKHAVTEVVQ